MNLNENFNKKLYKFQIWGDSRNPYTLADNSKTTVEIIAMAVGCFISFFGTAFCYEMITMPSKNVKKIANIIFIFFIIIISIYLLRIIIRSIFNFLKKNKVFILKIIKYFLIFLFRMSILFCIFLALFLGGLLLLIYIPFDWYLWLRNIFDRFFGFM